MFEELDRLLEEQRGEVVSTPVLGKVSVNQGAVASLRGLSIEELTEGQKVQCARDYFQSGNLSAIARERGVSYNDLLDMARQPWWAEEIKNLEREANALLKVRLTKMLGSTLDQLENRLTDGDLKWHDKGLRRIPVSARDLAVISSAIFEKKKAIEDSDNGFGSNEAKKLLGLAEALRAKGMMPQGEIVEGELVSERSENLTSNGEGS